MTQLQPSSWNNEQRVEFNNNKKSMLEVLKAERRRMWDKKKGLDQDDASEREPVELDELAADAHLIRDELTTYILPEAESLSHYFESLFQEGDSVCPVAFSFSDEFSSFQEMKSDGRLNDFLGAKNFMRFLKVGKDGLTRGFTDIPGHYFDFLPKEVRADVSEGGCTFKVHHEYPDGDFRNKEAFLKQCEQALENFRALVL